MAELIRISDPGVAGIGHIDTTAMAKNKIVVEAVRMGNDGIRSAQQIGLRRHPRAWVGVVADVAQRVPPSPGYPRYFDRTRQSAGHST